MKRISLMVFCGLSFGFISYCVLSVIDKRFDLQVGDFIFGYVFGMTFMAGQDFGIFIYNETTNN